MSIYRDMSHDGAADALARDEGLAAARDDAREAYCDGQLAAKLKEYAKQPCGDRSVNTESMWSLFAGRQYERVDPLDKPLSRMLIAIANMSDDAIKTLRTSSCDVADAALLIRDDIHALLTEEAAGEFDTAERKRGGL